MRQAFHNEDFSNILANDGNLFLKYLFDKYYVELCKLSFKYVGRTDVAEDVVQDVFINIWNKRNTLNYTGAIKPCFIRSVINASINHVQSKFVRQNRVDEDEALHNPTNYNQHDALVSQELDQLLKTAIEQLPDKCRAIFVLSRFSGLSYKEIADQLKISVKTVETQISIALKRIHDFLTLIGYFTSIILLLLFQII